jgi:endoribonuclease LACTB2
VSAPEGLYERVLAAGGGALPAPRPPRPSAAVVLWRSAGDRLEVFWIRRGKGLPFMAGWHAFPGGGRDRDDAALPVTGAPMHPAADEPTLPAPDWAGPLDADLAPGLAAAALRELFEETGVLLTRGGSIDDPRRLRGDLLAKRASLGAALATAGAALDAGRLAFAGRWLTPPFSPVRFDNRFFLAEWRPGDGEPSICPPESEAGEWIAPAEALAELATGRALAAPPILHLLRVLAEEGPDPASPRWRSAVEADLGPLRRIELRPGILLFPLAAATLPPASHTNAFVLGSGECVLVDPGSPYPEENERLLAALAAAERKPRPARRRDLALAPPSRSRRRRRRARPAAGGARRGARGDRRARRRARNRRSDGGSSQAPRSSSPASRRCGCGSTTRRGTPAAIWRSKWRAQATC